jgi:hypothetical protein
LRGSPLATISSLRKLPTSTRRFSTGKSQADLLVEELQELYSFPSFPFPFPFPFPFQYKGDKSNKRQLRNRQGRVRNRHRQHRQLHHLRRLGPRICPRRPQPAARCVQPLHDRHRHDGRVACAAGDTAG